VTTVLDPSELTLAVAAPPRRLEDALAIGAEHYALAPHENAGSPGALRRLAGSLADEEAARVGWRAGLRAAPHVWALGWR
jgi:hypothetical protein